MTLQERAARLRVDIPAIFIALGHPKTPWYTKILAAVTICYALSPLDLIPDFIPVLGYLDDLVILPALVALVIHFIPPAILAQCRTSAQGLWADGKPKKWYYALPILLIWMLALGFVLMLILHLKAPKN